MRTDTRPPLAKMLRRARRFADYTQAEMAERLGISTRSIAAYEGGETEPPATVVARWLYLCERPMDDLLDLCAPRDLNPEPAEQVLVAA